MIGINTLVTNDTKPSLLNTLLQTHQINSNIELLKLVHLYNQLNHSVDNGKIKNVFSLRYCFNHFVLFFF